MKKQKKKTNTKKTTSTKKKRKTRTGEKKLKSALRRLDEEAALAVKEGRGEQFVKDLLGEIDKSFARYAAQRKKKP